MSMIKITPIYGICKFILFYFANLFNNILFESVYLLFRIDNLDVAMCDEKSITLKIGRVA